VAIVGLRCANVLGTVNTQSA